MARASTVANYKQAADAELEIGLGHLRAALSLWSPGSGLSPTEEQADSEVAAWHRLKLLVQAIELFAREEGPGA